MSKREKIAKLLILKIADQHGLRLSHSLFINYVRDYLGVILGNRPSWRTVSRYIDTMEELGLIENEDDLIRLKPQELTLREILAIKTAYEKLIEGRRVKND